MARCLTVSTVGFDSKNRSLIKALLNLYAGRLTSKWRVSGDADANSAFTGMDFDADADVLIVDVDSDAGRRTWYVAQALKTHGLLVALTDQPDKALGDYVITKPLHSGQEIVSLLNSFNDAA